jgi:hypothetical protein
VPGFFAIAAGMDKNLSAKAVIKQAAEFVQELDRLIAAARRDHIIP